MQTSNTNLLRDRLETDRKWSAYALGDLAPGFFEKSQWYYSEAGDGLILIYRGLDIPVMFTMGCGSSVKELLAEVIDIDVAFLSVTEDILLLLHEEFSVSDEQPMWRMVYTPKCSEPVNGDTETATTAVTTTAAAIAAAAAAAAATAPAATAPAATATAATATAAADAPAATAAATAAAATAPAAATAATAERVYESTGAVRLQLNDVPLLEELFSDGATTGESPDFFSPSMVEQGCFFGLFDETRLVSVAGTHLVAPEENVGAVGCVYTRKSHRGQGLASIATAEVVHHLRQSNIDTIVLNVKQNNTAAIRVYEKLGFVKYCAFYEGMVRKRLRVGT